MNKKYVAIAAILIFIVIVGLMIMRGRKDRYESDEASELLSEIIEQLKYIGTLWTNIKTNLEDMEILSVENDISEIRKQIDKAKAAREDIKEMKTDLESIRNQQDKSQKTIEEIKKLELPEWTYDYIELLDDRTGKDKERVEKTDDILTNLNLFYEYSEEFYEGKIAEINMEEKLEEGINDFLEENINSARENFKEAIDYNSKVKEYITAASEKIPFDYLEEARSNREDAEKIIKKLQEVCDLVEKGSYNEANDLFQQAEKEYNELKRLYPSDLIPEHREWWSNNIDSPKNELREFSRSIENIENKMQSLIKEHIE